jgi:hypothetical protein
MDGRTELPDDRAMRMDRPAIPPDGRSVRSDDCAASPDDRVVRTDGRGNAPFSAKRIRPTTVVKAEVAISVNPGNSNGV